MSDELEIVTTIHGITKKSHDREEFEEFMENSGFSDEEEFIEYAEKVAKSNLLDAFEEDALELLEVVAEVNEAGST